MYVKQGSPGTPSTVSQAAINRLREVIFAPALTKPSGSPVPLCLGLVFSCGSEARGTRPTPPV